MILVDSSVWIDYFRGARTPQANRLDEILGIEPIAVGDMILTEVLQGVDSDRDFNEVRRLMSSFEQVTIGGLDIAIDAAMNFRRLRQLGITPHKTIDTVIATRCIVSGLRLLHNDRDFDAFERHLGLQCVDCAV